MKLQRFVSIVLTLFSIGGLHGVEWSEPECLADHGGHPTLLINNQHTLWCVAEPSILSYRDEMSGWQLETESILGGTGTTGMSSPACFDKGDNLWMLKHNDWRIYYSRWDGETWSDVDTVPTYPSWVGFAGIIADSNGCVWVGWSTDWWEYWKVAYNRYEDGSWDEPKPVTDTFELTDSELRSMTTGAYGRVWFGWKNTPGQLYNCTPVRAIYHDGDTWSEEFTIYAQDSTYTDSPDLAPDRDGGVWALWSSNHGYDSFFVQASYWNGESWSQVDTIAEAGDLLGFPVGKIAVDGNGNVWAVWRQALEEPYDKYGDIYYSVNTGSGWSEPAPVSEHPAVDYNPDIAVDGEGRVWCVWSSNRDDSAGIWASYTWGVGVEEPVTPITHHLPSLTIDKSIGQEFTFHIPPLISDGELIIYDASGRKVRHFMITDNQAFCWDGTDERGRHLPLGVYFATMRLLEFTVQEKVLPIK